MNKRVHKQVTTRVQTKKLAIQHVRKLGDWMPVRRVKGGKGPGYSRQRQTTCNNWVITDVYFVIKADELMAYDLCVNTESDNCETECDPEIRSP